MKIHISFLERWVQRSKQEDTSCPGGAPNHDPQPSANGKLWFFSKKKVQFIFITVSFSLELSFYFSFKKLI